MARGGHVRRGSNARSRGGPSRSIPDMSRPIPPVADQNIPFSTGTPMPSAPYPSGPQVSPSVHGSDGLSRDSPPPRVPYTSTPVLEDMSPHLPTTPPVGPSTSVPGPSTSVPGPSTAVPETSVASNDGRMFVYVENKILEPHSETGRIIFGIFKQRFHSAGSQWKLVPEEMIEFYWQEFQKACWYVQPEDVIKPAWRSLAGRRYSDNLSRWKSEGKQPACVNKDCWDSWQRDWATPEFVHRSKVASANRRSETGGLGSGMSKHSGGSITTSQHARLLEKKLGRKPTAHEVFVRMHTKKGTSGVFIDPRSQQVNDRYNNLMATASVQEDGSPVDPDSIDSSQIYLQAVGGATKKRPIYGLGTEASGYYPSLASTSSSTAYASFLDTGLEERLRSTLKEELTQQVRNEVQEEMQTMREKLARYDSMEVRLTQVTSLLEQVLQGKMPSTILPPSAPTGSFPPSRTDDRHADDDDECHDDEDDN